mmetsp:Transcript_62417/g.202317  ORF Transcript_62417/g.202317 Transcript_62417/m.202317 type:complete len:194 (-) Transcript_62417:565-1146(-)
MGYVPLKGEHANPTRSPDLHEAFVIKSRRCFENDFRGTPAGFEETTSIFWDKAEKAARRFQIACALALDLPVSDLDFFARTTHRFDMSALKYNYYPPCDFEAGSSDGECGSAAIRIGEHTDFGILTFLFLDGAAPGLQVRPSLEGDALNIVGSSAASEKGWTEAPGRGGGHCHRQQRLDVGAVDERPLASIFT